MPTCVVKCCVRSSGRDKKQQGITFHRFPKENEWRKDWIQIIRQCRQDMNWTPTKSSVVCSEHFQKRDLYITKGGLVRVVTFGVPQKFLWKQPGDEQQNVHNVLEITLEEPLHEHASSSEHNQLPIKIEKPTLAEEPLNEHVSSSDQEQRFIEFEKPTTLLEVCCICLQTFNKLISIEAYGLLTAYEQLIGVSLKLHHQLPRKLCVECATLLDKYDKFKDKSIKGDQILRHTYYDKENLLQDETDMVPAEANFEQPSSILYSPSTRHLKKQLLDKDLHIKHQKQKIKILNQKVRRLTSRNSSLKKNKKALKSKMFVNADLYNGPNENLVAANLFSAYNRKKIRKKIKYTPVFLKFCMTLNNYSPKAYEYVRKNLNTCLPHRKTLSKRYGHIKGDSRFTEESSMALKANPCVFSHFLDTSSTRISEVSLALTDTIMNVSGTTLNESRG